MIRLTRTIERSVECWLPVAVYGALPTIGVIAGPSYAALVFGLAIARLLYGLAAGRGSPPIDRDLLWIALAFAALCWASAAWSIVPRHSLESALQMTAIAAGALIFIAQRPLPERVAERLFQVLLIACVAGAFMVFIDKVLDFPLESLLTGRPGVQSSTKYNRGLDYLVLLAWPELAWLWWRRYWKCTVVFAAAVIGALMLGSSLAGKLAGVIGAIVFALAWYVPRLVATGLVWGTVALAALLPVALHRVSANRALLVPYIKVSGINRLEIWDYMTARVLERPLHGWGLASASVVPIRPDELAHYIYVKGTGTYPHNQWLELWIETGALGTMIGLVLAVVVLRRIWHLPAGLRPFGYAAFASAMTIACINFEVTTDSWWAALAASGFLFMTLRRVAPDAARRDRAPG